MRTPTSRHGKLPTLFPRQPHCSRETEGSRLLGVQESSPGSIRQPATGASGGGHTSWRLTFPPVTEKLANMQYFSFLWPVYVFRHWNGKGS